jgi:hypothetical protein
MRLPKQIPITTASAAPDSVGEAHVPVFVPPYVPQNTTRASSASGAIVPNPPGCEGRYWRRRASDSGRSSWRAPDMPCHDGSSPRTAAPCSGPAPDVLFEPIWQIHCGNLSGRISSRPRYCLNRETHVLSTVPFFRVGTASTGHDPAFHPVFR